MGKQKSKKDKARSSRKRSDAKAEIKTAEKRLAKALAGVDAARDKAARRERDLTALLKKHGREKPATVDIESVVADAIPLDAPSQQSADNGAHESAADASEEAADTAADEAEQAVSSGESESGG